jgi:hypothetical protein
MYKYFNGNNHELDEYYRAGFVVSYRKPDMDIWNEVIPYEEPDSMYRISNKNYHFRVYLPEENIGVYIYKYNDSPVCLKQDVLTVPNIILTFVEGKLILVKVL